MIAELIRRALETCRAGRQTDLTEALARTFRAVPDIDPPSRDAWAERG